MTRTINDEERRLWVLNDEGLYNLQQRSGRTVRGFVRENRPLIDEVIHYVVEGVKPSHYLAYGSR